MVVVWPMQNPGAADREQQKDVALQREGETVPKETGC